ncbi:transposase, mutator type [Roseibium sp. TrichSKD4]|nr:transposase, mutator type [Roseibium sp. TrichSKD4]
MRRKSWRKLRGFHHLADVIQGFDFINGIKPSNQNQAAA